MTAIRFPDDARDPRDEARAPAVPDPAAWAAPASPADAAPGAPSVDAPPSRPWSPGRAPSPRAAVREALRWLVAESGEWPFATPVVLRNRLMDECGGDVRPLATLLLQAREHGYDERVRAVPPDDRSRWEALRTQLTLAWVAEGFIQPEAARWAIETWAYVQGVVTADQLVTARPTPATPAVPPPPVARPAPTPPRAAPRQASYNRPPIAPGRAVRPSVAPPMVRAGSPRFGAPNRALALRITAAMTVLITLAAIPALRRAAEGEVPPAPTLPVSAPVRGATATAPAPAPDGGGAAAPNGSRGAVADADEVAAAAGDVLADAGDFAADTDAGGARIGLEIPATGAGPGGGGGGGDGPTSGAAGVLPALPGELPVRGDNPGVTGLTRGALPGERARRIRPAQRAEGTSNGLPRGTIPMTGVVATLPMADAVRLKDGAQLRGRVEVIRASTVLFRDEASGLRYEIPKPDIEEIVTEFGSRVRFNAAGGAITTRRGALVDRGVGGRYDVTYTMKSVTGSASCRGLWQRPLSGDVVRVYHEAGADTLVVGFDGGDTFPSLIDRDAWFASTLRIDPSQAERETALTTRLNGRFTEDGFTGEVHVIGYQRGRGADDTTCYSIVGMTATRQAGASRPGD